jgi:hypothetical protein
MSRDIASGLFPASQQRSSALEYHVQVNILRSSRYISQLISPIVASALFHYRLSCIELGRALRVRQESQNIPSVGPGSAADQTQTHMSITWQDGTWKARDQKRLCKTSKSKHCLEITADQNNVFVCLGSSSMGKSVRQGLVLPCRSRLVRQTQDNRHKRSIRKNRSRCYVLSLPCLILPFSSRFSMQPYLKYSTSSDKKGHVPDMLPGRDLHGRAGTCPRDIHG